MIYNRLDILPYKILMEILATGNVSLLSTEAAPEADLQLLWERLETEYIQLNPHPDEDKVVKYAKEVYYFELKYKQVIAFCKALQFDYDEEILDILIEYGYSITKDNYINQLETVEREAKSLLDKALKYKSLIPKPEEGKKSTIDDMFASYSVILGQDLGDYNTITTTKTIALGKQIDLKIKALEQNNKPQ